MSVKERMQRGVQASFLAQLAYIAANGALMIALTRYLLTPRGYGLLNYALSILGVTQLFVGIGVAKSGAKYVTEYLEKDPGQVPHVLKWSLAVMTALIVAVGAVYSLFAGRLASLLGEPGLDPLLLVGIGYLAFYSLGTYIRLVFQAFNRITYSAFVHATEGVSRLLFAVGFVLAGLGAVGALLGYVAGYVVAILVGGAVFFRKFYPQLEIGSEQEPGLRRRIVRYAVPLTATSGADVLDKKVDTILIGILLNATAVGYYALAKQISTFAVVPASSIDSTIAPRMGEQKASDQIDRAAEIYQFSFRHVLLLYVPAAVGLVLVAEPAVRHIFGRSYLPAVPVVQVFGLFVVINAVNKITTNSLDYLGLGRERAIANGTTSIGNALLNLALIPVFGVVGAAIATVFTHSAYMLLNVYYIHRELSLNLRRLTVNTVLIGGIAVAMGAAVAVLLPLVSSLLSLALVIGTGVVVWAVLAVFSGVLDVSQVRSALA